MPSTSTRIWGLMSTCHIWKPTGGSNKLMPAWFATTNSVWRSTNFSWREDGRYVWTLFWIHYYSVHAGQNESGRILSESILKYIGLSAPWLTKARKERLPNYLTRLALSLPTRILMFCNDFHLEQPLNGKDILTFLKAPANTAGIQWIITLSHWTVPRWRNSFLVFFRFTPSPHLAFGTMITVC